MELLVGSSHSLRYIIDNVMTMISDTKANLATFKYTHLRISCHINDIRIDFHGFIKSVYIFGCELL
jgi:hypothetical protein